MPSAKKIIIDQESAGQRLDVFLSEKLGIARSQTQKMIEAGQISLNGRVPKKTGESVKEGGEIIISEKIAKTPAVTNVLQTEAKEQKIEEPKIIAETSDYVVVNKPSGMLTHPTQAEENNSLSGWLMKKYPEIKNVGDDPVRPGIVHRLDKEASGLLVIARTQKMFNHLKEQFKSRTINKEYLVLVHGKIEREEGVIDFPIERSETADKMAAVPKIQKGQPTDLGKEALTEFLVEKFYVNFTLLRVKIHTGRMHQIRAHMLAYNHPVVGDPLYFQKKQKRVWDEKCGRLFLHSTKLGFTELDGNSVEFEALLPEKLEKFLPLLT